MSRKIFTGLCVGMLTVGALGVLPMASAQTSVPVAGTATSTTLSGTVTVVNVDKRMLTIKTDEGRFVVLRVPPEVQRLDQIKIGNALTVTKTHLLLLDLVKGDAAAGVGVGKESSIIQGPETKPSGAIIDSVTIKGVVESVDREASTVTVRGPSEVRTFKVEDPALLDAVAPGDGVTATYATVIDGEVTFQ
ncbi:copper-binding protein [Thiorhodococcus fuscus]|uniref:Copper-binding protein n=1 Tax=Thiorhodococcus fuscus TaxID=527200 RepID=A0ABW4Y7R1_9GAMM